MATLMQQQPQQKVSGKRNNETISMYCYSIVCLSFCTSFDLIFFFFQFQPMRWKWEENENQNSFEDPHTVCWIILPNE